jgi:hypothetical protein
MYKFGKKYAMVTDGISMTQLIAMAADVAYQAIIKNSSKIRMLTNIDITTPSYLLSLMEIGYNEEDKMLFIISGSRHSWILIIMQELNKALVTNNRVNDY